jgi:hypothetical protein
MWNRPNAKSTIETRPAGQGMKNMRSRATDVAFSAVTGASTDDAARAEPANALRHIASLSMTKLADGLIDPKLVLSWLLTNLGASSVVVGLLVPIREAGALLPQLFTAARIHAMARRKWAWAGGSAVQGIAAGLIALVAVTQQGWIAGALTCALLAVLAVARSVCSVSYKDVLGKTVGKTRRGSVTGFASSAAAMGVIGFAGLLMIGAIPRGPLVIGAIALAGLFWLLAAVLFTGLREAPSPGTAPDGTALAQFRILKDDPQLARFVLVRGLLVGTALAPPFLIVLAAQAGQGAFDRLGALVLASSVASLISSYVWGRLSDRSSRKVLILSGVVAAIALLAAIALDMGGLTGTIWALPVCLFVLMVAYHGVRQGRSTYLVDMAPPDRRAAYTAVANTLIGLILLGAGMFGAALSGLGPVLTIGLFAALSLAGAVVALGLDEVEAR